MKHLKLLIIITLLISCKNNNDKYKNLDFGSFEVIVPYGWNQIEYAGIDSFVGKIAIDKNDTIQFDLGWYSFDLTEEDFPIIIDKNDLEYILKTNSKIDTTQYVIVEDIKNVIYSDYSKIIVSYTQIDSYNAKIVTPKKIGNGLTGVYIDSLWGDDYAKTKFNLYGINLSENNQKELLKAIKTLKFKTSK